MTLERIARRSAPDEVFDQIVAEVVGGERKPGDSLPSERQLAEVLGVSRPTVREAIQRMTQAGLVEVRHGEGTTIRDFRRHAGLDLLGALLVRRGEVDLAVARSILDARLHIGPTVAALAAERAGDRLSDPLAEAISALAGTEDLVDAQRIAMRFWDTVVDGADSIVFRLLFNSLRAAYEPAMAALAAVMATEVRRVPAYRVLADAITGGAPEAAREAAVDLLTPATSAFLAAFRQLEDS